MIKEGFVAFFQFYLLAFFTTKQLLTYYTVLVIIIASFSKDKDKTRKYYKQQNKTMNNEEKTIKITICVNLVLFAPHKFKDDIFLQSQFLYLYFVAVFLLY